MTLPVVYSEDYVTPLPEGHRFPMPKFKLLYDLAVDEGLIQPDQIYKPRKATPAELALAHLPPYIDAFLHGNLPAAAIRKIGLPWSPQLVVRTCTAVGGTILTARLALQHGLACNLAGGTHHAFAGHGSGFCIFNDLAVAAAQMLEQREAGRILIVDLDVHQGDGTAAIFANDPRVFTFSMHCDRNFPFVKQKSNLDLEVAEETGDADYLKLLQQTLPELLDKVQPDLVFYDAGVDPHYADALGKLALTDAGILERDAYVVDTCISASIPLACVIGGGYAKDRNELAFRHSLVVRAALRAAGRSPETVVPSALLPAFS